MDAVTLREFVEPVPTCVETDSLMDIWQVFQAGWEQVIIVDSRQIPLGIIRLQQFIRHIDDFTGVAAPLTVDRRSDLLGVNDLSNDLAPLQRQLNDLQRTLSGADAAFFIRNHLEPAMSLLADWGVEQIQPYLSELRNHHWIVVNSDGHYIGLLDRLQLLQFLVTHSTPSSPPTPPPTPPSPSSTPPIALPTHEPAHASPPVIDPLIDLLERLPVPLMLQTSAGRVITQNLAWRKQVNGLRDPAQLGKEAAVILESLDWTDSNSSGIQQGYPPVDGDASGNPPDPISFSAHPFQATLNAGEGAHPLRYMGACRLSMEPNGCVCICPMKSGHDRVWKFLRIPMGIASSQIEESQHMFRSGVNASHAASPPFKLATLGFSPDPAWRSLAQTEFLWLIFAQDITEQHQIARELSAKNADLVQLNRLKDEFLACVTHELKTPLTAVLGLSSLLKNKMLGDLNERQSRYAHLIYQSGRHLILIVNDILDLTRIETGQMELTLEPIQIAPICQAAYDQARQIHAVESNSEVSPETNAVAIDFSLEIQPGLETLVADEFRLRQMLSNLLSNALKFTEPGGAIGLRVEEWESWIAFTVWDTGIGIPSDKQHLIFQKFQQLETPLTRQFEGTGLGLVLTQRLARLHGGDVTFTSVEGRGSQFTLLLPPSPPQIAKERAVSTPQHPHPSMAAPITTASITSQSRLMLIVEADPKLIEELSRQLVGLGYRVAIARSGTEALEKVRRLQPGLVFLNPLLPLLSGWDVLTLLKADEETSHIPVVVTATRVEREQAYQNGANGFLSLPIRKDLLQRCVERLTDQSSHEAEGSSFSLTVLHLHETISSETAHEIGVSANQSDSVPRAKLQDLNSLLHAHRCRVLEVDDLEQANLLAQVWKPNVILLDGTFEDPLNYVKQLSLYPALAALPLVTLTPDITHAANLIPGLLVMPYLASTSVQPGAQSDGASHRHDGSALWQVIQMAAGIHWTPHILVADISALEDDWNVAAPMDLQQPAHLAIDDAAKPFNAVQALVQYIQIAGFRSSMGRSWQQILQQLEHHSVDLLLFCIHSGRGVHPLFLEIMQTLEQLENKPPILVWNYRTESSDSPEEIQAMENRWGAIATEILPTSLSMPELLTHINRALASR